MSSTVAVDSVSDFDAPDQPVAVQDRLVDLETVLRPGVDQHGPRESLRGADRDDLGGQDPIAPQSRHPEQVVELLGAATAVVVGALLEPELRVLLLELLEAGLLVVGEATEEVADRRDD